MAILDKKLPILMLVTALGGSCAIAADNDDLSIEELQNRLRMVTQQNDEIELERQREETRLREEQAQRLQREELLRQIAEQEKRKVELQKPIEIPQQNEPKNLPDSAGDFVTNGIKSLVGTGNPSHVNANGDYVPSDFVQSREALKDSAKQLFRKFF